MTIWEVEGDGQEVDGLDEDGQPDPAYAAALGLVRAPLGRRALGFAIDLAAYLVLQLPYWIFTLPLLLKFYRGRLSWYGVRYNPEFTLAVIALGASTLLTLAFVIAQLVLHGRKGVTLGKAVTGLRSVNVATLEQPGFFRVLLRSLVLWASSVVVVGPVLFLLSPLFDSTKRGRGWHDKLGKTWLIDIRHGLNPYDAKRMRIARKAVRTEPVASAVKLPSLATPLDRSEPQEYRPGARVSAGVLGVARPHGAGPRPVVGLSYAEGSLATGAGTEPPTPGQPVIGGYRGPSTHEDQQAAPEPAVPEPSRGGASFAPSSSPSFGPRSSFGPSSAPRPMSPSSPALPRVDRPAAAPPPLAASSTGSAGPLPGTAPVAASAGPLPTTRSTAAPGSRSTAASVSRSPAPPASAANAPAANAPIPSAPAPAAPATAAPVPAASAPAASAPPASAPPASAPPASAPPGRATPPAAAGGASAPSAAGTSAPVAPVPVPHGSAAPSAGGGRPVATPASPVRSGPTSTGPSAPVVPAPVAASAAAAPVAAAPPQPANPGTPTSPPQPAAPGSLGPQATPPISAPAPGSPCTLVLDSGQRVVIDTVVVIGRNPVPPPGEEGARAHPVADDTRSISKSHALLRSVAGGVEIVDQGSTNGTVVVHEGREQPLEPGRPMLARVGDTIRFGDRIALVMSS